MELWKIMNNGPYSIPKIKNDKGKDIKKPKDQYMSADWDRLTKNSRVKYILYCGLNTNENYQISVYDTSKIDLEQADSHL